MNNKQPKVSIIIPVYSAERYIEQCLVSLFQQSLNDIEYIFVDDCCQDKSIEIIRNTAKRYPFRSSQIRIISHDINKGQAASRTTGMKVATGEYIIHCDPDDYVSLQMYQSMYDYAKKYNADIVCCGIKWTNSQRERERDKYHAKYWGVDKMYY